MSHTRELRAQKDELFRDDPQSPLTSEQQLDFEGLKYYPEDPTYDVIATLDPLDALEPVTLITSRGSAAQFYRVGHLHFSLANTSHQLTLFQDEGVQYLFLPFTDRTSGSETYGAGRYVEVEDAGVDGGRQRIRIDFNQAYNPYCAYNENWVCPIPPGENSLSIRIPAGEKIFEIEPDD